MDRTEIIDALTAPLAHDGPRALGSRLLRLRHPRERRSQMKSQSDLRLCDDFPMSFTRITVQADQMGGVPCVRGLRIPVATVVGMIADGMSKPEILAAYPDLEGEDVREAMRYAAEAVRERELPLVAG
jgi:uncharacterized protein (DUF433 family)